MKLRTITVESRQRGLPFISQLFWISWSEKHREPNSETNRKTWRAMSTVYVLFLMMCTRSLAAEPKTIAFLEEHNVAAGTPQTVGALYVVPPGRKAYVSNMVARSGRSTILATRSCSSWSSPMRQSLDRGQVQRE